MKEGRKEGNDKVGKRDERRMVEDGRKEEERKKEGKKRGKREEEERTEIGRGKGERGTIWHGPFGFGPLTLAICD